MNLFGTDGIRGIANSSLNWRTAFKLGRVMGLEMPAGLPLSLGKDTRLSGDMLEAAIIAGITSAGKDVLRLGVVTTPGLSFLTKDIGLGGGVMISASHNPAEYNGLKVFGADGKKIPDGMEEAFSRFINEDSDGDAFPTGKGIGRVIPGQEIVGRYEDFLCGIPTHSFSGLQVVLDAANGSTSGIAPKVWTRLGASVHPINNTPDGLNINAACGSTSPEILARRVLECSAHAGFAYDGDGDRCIMVDETGQVLDGDHAMAILALDMMDAGRLSGGAVVGTVMANFGLEACLSCNNLKLERTPVGDRYVLEKMEECGFNLGGEQSGHIIVRDKLWAGDGILTSLLIADVMAKTGKKLSELGSVMTKIPQHLVNVPASDPKALAKSEAVVAAVSKAQDDLGMTGRVLVRPSGTEPVVRIMVESFDSSMVQSCIQYLEEVIARENGLGSREGE